MIKKVSQSKCISSGAPHTYLPIYIRIYVCITKVVGQSSCKEESSIDFEISHVKEMVTAYRTPDFTLSTKCTFSAPDVNIATRPFLGSKVTLNGLVDFPSKNMSRPPVKSTP